MFNSVIDLLQSLAIVVLGYLYFAESRDNMELWQNQHQLNEAHLKLVQEILKTKND